jgi:hypothetical protein
VDGETGPGYLFQVSFPLPQLEEKLPPAPPLWPDKAKERIEHRWAAYSVIREKAKLVDDDRVPYISNITGTEIFAEAFGCKVHRTEENMPFALPFVQNAAEADAVREPELSTSSLAYLFDIADELYRRGGPGTVMKPVDIQSPMDIVALIWDKADLFIAMLETPEAVKDLAAKVRRLLTAFMDEWFGRYGTVHVAHFPDYVMHGGLTLSVDEVGAVGEEMFREFFRDELVALSEHFGGLGIHCCADARHQWQNFKDLPGLKVMNYCCPPTSAPGQYLWDSLRFNGNSMAQIPSGWTGEGPPETWPAQQPEGTRLIFGTGAEDAAQAARLAEKLQQARDLP